MQPDTAVSLPAGISLQHTDAYTHLQFSQTRHVVSSAVLNGGSCQADGILNLRVSGESADEQEDPAITLHAFAAGLHPGGTSVGMMTAASMDSLRVKSEELEGHTLCVLVTTGLRNARRAGDFAELRSLALHPGTPGTINIIALCSASIATAAMIEMTMIVTEAKAAVLQELQVASPVSGNVATGTGTDAVAIVSGCTSPSQKENAMSHLRYAGKHTLLGERLAVLTMDAIRSSLDYTEQDLSCV